MGNDAPAQMPRRCTGNVQKRIFQSKQKGRQTIAWGLEPMKKIILILLFIATAAIGQNNYFTQTLWGAAADTIDNITKQDTLYYRAWIDGTAGTWHAMSNYISASEKTSETNQEYNFSDDSNWLWAEYFEFKIVSGADYILSGTVTGAWLRGAVSGILIPDTSGTHTKYTMKIGGN